jgi:hypothetical protein
MSLRTICCGTVVIREYLTLWQPYVVVPYAGLLELDVVLQQPVTCWLNKTALTISAVNNLAFIE